ncbi:hypothetical protein IJ541_11315 [bacterium]|nr:hypothetical protein [bacterium]
MEKVLTGEKDCDILDRIFSNENIINGAIELSCKKPKNKKTLTSCIMYAESFSEFGTLIINDELSNKLTFQIAYKLAQAIDKNSIIDIKKIKYEYGKTKEFANAKEFLNKKCKEIWNIYENKSSKLEIPVEAMKTLGITNKPSLDFLLENSLNFYEKDNRSTTVDIINSILENKNLDYNFNDIYNYLVNFYRKKRCKYNFLTAQYMAENLDYNKTKLDLLGIDKNLSDKIFKTLSFTNKIKYIIKNKFNMY